MADYVRRGKVEFELCGGNLPEKYKAFVRRVLNDKNLVPAADVAEVVRCKYCRHLGAPLSASTAHFHLHLRKGTVCREH